MRQPGEVYPMSNRSYDLTARARDVVLSAVGLVVLAPVLAGTAVAVARSLGRPVLFRQERPGRAGRVFTLIKFRTLLPQDPTSAAPDADRLTPQGARIRAASLDELPSLWNVLRGDMALVGPRPLLVDYLDRYSPEQARRHAVRPGLTGWAQVNGRNAVTWEDRLAMDVWYVDHRSHALDARILWMTIRVVVRRDGISAEGHATMPEFLGP
jgi:lipopolysaccharide/colanic/teichoic acid biosynthesis glycosyltransferase